MVPWWATPSVSVRWMCSYIGDLNRGWTHTGKMHNEFWAPSSHSPLGIYHIWTGSAFLTFGGFSCGSVSILKTTNLILFHWSQQSNADLHHLRSDSMASKQEKNWALHHKSYCFPFLEKPISNAVNGTKILTNILTFCQGSYCILPPTSTTNCEFNWFFYIPLATALIVSLC